MSNPGPDSPQPSPPAADQAASKAATRADEAFASWRELLEHALTLSPHYEIFDGDNIRFRYAYQGDIFNIFFRHTRRSSGTFHACLRNHRRLHHCTWRTSSQGCQSVQWLCSTRRFSSLLRR